jgi:AbrB family looped-hinge helix DNA binding protein
MTTKGQVTVPAEVRARLGLTAGTKIEFTEEGGRYLISVKRGRSADLAGFLPRPEVPVTLEEMRLGIAEGAAMGAGL